MPDIHAHNEAPTDRQAVPHFEPEQIREHLHHLDRSNGGCGPPLSP